MKKIFFTWVVTIFITGAILNGCNSPAQKIKNAEEKVQDAKEAVLVAKSDLNLARQDSLTDIQQFKTEFENQIIVIEKSISEIRISIVGASAENKIINQKKLAELEKRNNELKIKLTEYKEGGAEKWQTFKSEFKHDMDELGKAFSDFTVSSTK